MITVICEISALILILYFIIRHRRNIGAIHSNKCHYFNNVQVSSQEFYSTLEDIIKDRQMPGAKMSRVEYHQRYIFSNKREYLRIERDDDIFDLCAAPFGTGFFISYWHGEPKKRIREMALKMPFLGTAVEGWQGKTFYQIDTASMFKACVKDGIIEAIEQITTAKGVRGLSEAEYMALKA